MDIRKLRIVSASAAMVVAGFGISQQAHGQIAMNGTIDPAFGTPLAYSQVPTSAGTEAQQIGGYTGAPGAGNTTGFADGTDIEASYATIRANTLGQPTLYMFFSGNLSSGLNFDQTPPTATGSTPLGDFLNLFIQTGAGGLNTLGGDTHTLNSDAKFQHMVGTANPITFDSTFSPNYRFALQEVGGTKTGGGTPGETSTSDFNLYGYFGNLNTGVELSQGNTNAAGGTQAPLHGTNANGGSAEGINFNINNSNTIGVDGVTLPSQAAQAAITTGVVMQIPLASISEGAGASSVSTIKIGYMTMQGNNNASPSTTTYYRDDISNQVTNLAPGYLDYTGLTSVGNNTNLADGAAGGDATKLANPANTLNMANQPGGNHYFVINNVGNLTWNNTGGTGNGITWDAAAQNFNNGAAPTSYSDGSLVTFNDSNNANYNVTLNATVTPGTVTVNSSSNYTISGTGGITGAGAFQNIGTGVTTLATANTYTGGTFAAQGKLVVGAAGALPTNGKLTIGTTGLESGGAITATAAVVQLAPNTGVVNLSSLTINGANPSLGLYAASTLDINNNHVFINYGTGPDPIGSVITALQHGYDNGAWDGTAAVQTGVDGLGNPIFSPIGSIISTTAQTNNTSYGIAYADSADPGNPAGLAPGQIEIMYTLLGDANLDGKVNGSDFSILAVNFNKAVSGWDQGDFNYDGKDNGADFTDLAANFNKGASQSADVAALDSFAAANGLTLTADVPEPASFGLAATGIISILSRRRRRN